jgi:hypothetical protein
MPPVGRKVGVKAKVRDLDVPADVAKQATPKVRALTVGDLNDLARKFEGIAVANTAIDGLSAKDISSLEDVFHGAKMALAEQVSEGESEAEIFDNWSCCCCTPCCCCAAAEVDPFVEEVLA